VVAEYEAAPHGQKAAVLRREGLYQSQIREWTMARAALACDPAVPRRLHRARDASGGKEDPSRLLAEKPASDRELAQVTGGSVFSVASRPISAVISALAGGIPFGSERSIAS
jgi:hypothetical protein